MIEKTIDIDRMEQAVQLFGSFDENIKELEKEYGVTILSRGTNKLAAYKDAEEQGLLLRLPCKVGDTVYVDSTILPIKDMECENIDHKIPLYFPARIVSFRFAKRNWMKIAVKAKWLHEWIDNETGPESAYINSEKKFTISLSGIGKTVLLTESEAEAKLKEMEKK